MPRPVGGRGKKNKYETTHVRVPKPIKDQVVSLVNRFHDDGQFPIESKSLSKEEAVIEARRILKMKKSASKSLSKLLTTLYGEVIEL